jgi:hypothetical protein
MAELTEQQKLEIVEALACFRTSAEIIKHFGAEYGIEMDSRQVGGYDPTRPYYEAGDKWREIFEVKRKQYLEDVAAVPVANQGYRLQRLQHYIAEAEKAKNWKLAAELHEQAAKEVGGVLTNERNLRVDDNRAQRVRDMSPEDRRAAFAELVRQALEQSPQLAAARVIDQAP